MLPTYDPKRKEWVGVKRPTVLNPEASIGQVVFSLLNMNPDNIIQIDADTGRSMTNGEMRLKAIRAAQNLTALGIRRGDMVALACANSENVAPMVLAMLTIGIPLNPLAPNYGLDDMTHMLKITQPKLVFCDANNFEKVKSASQVAIKDAPIYYVFECDLPGVNKAEDLFKETGTEQTFFPPYLGDSHKQLSVVICSSGTTGLPKGVCVSHATPIIHCSSFTGMPKLLFNFSPLYWTTGFYTLIMSWISGSTRLITRKPFDENLCFDLLEKYPVDFMFTPPSHANLLLQHPRIKDTRWPNIKVWMFGGSLLTEKIRTGIAELLPNGMTMNSFGNSEIGGISSDMLGRKPNSVGTISPNIRVKIVDDNGTALGNNERGELLIKFCEEFMGYYNNPEATAECLDADGWFRTGDVGYVDEEGYLFIVDRKKDLLKYHNYQIAPLDLEMIVEKIDEVNQVCVIGLPDDDGASDLPAAVIVKKSGSDLQESDVINFVNGQVADYKKLRGGVFFVPEFPLTLSGKPLRRQLKEMVVEMLKSWVV